MNIEIEATGRSRRHSLRCGEEERAAARSRLEALEGGTGFPPKAPRHEALERCEDVLARPRRRLAASGLFLLFMAPGAR